MHIGKKRIDNEIQVSLKIYIYGQSQVIINWIKKGFLISPEDLALFIARSLPQNLISFYQFDSTHKAF